MGRLHAGLVITPEIVLHLSRNARRAESYCGAVASLSRSLEERGARLLCRRGPLVATALALARECGAASVTLAFSYDAITLELQRDLQSALEEAGLRATLVHDAPAVHPEETAAARSDGAGSGYRAFAPYFEAWSAQPKASVTNRLTFATSALESEALPEPAEFGHSPSVRGDAPSEQSALAALDAYLAAPALAYASASKIPAGEPTARLSAPLGLGTIAARTVLARIDARARDPFLLAEERYSLRALTRSIAQRDFFLQLAWFFEGSPDAPLQERMRRFPLADSHPLLPAWREGRTGFALVDAGVRQLRTTGWMHPRVRLVVASFLCFDLAVDWRVGRDEWERELEEDDGALATGNWQWVAGVGADLAQFPRIYNPRRQARALDPTGSYVRRYVDELANVPEHHVFRAETAAAQLALPLYDDARYPAPVLDHDVAARAYLARYARYAAEPEPRAP